MCKIVPILNFPIPAKRKQFRTFLGQINWLALFIKNLPEIKVPLTDLIRKTVRWSWEGGRQQKAIYTLFFLLRQASVLASPDLRSTLYFTLRYLIETPQPIKTLGFYRTARILFEIVTENLSFRGKDLCFSWSLWLLPKDWIDRDALFPHIVVDELRRTVERSSELEEASNHYSQIMTLSTLVVDAKS